MIGLDLVFAFLSRSCQTYLVKDLESRWHNDRSETIVS